MNDAELLCHLHAVQELVSRAPQRGQIVCGTSPRATDNEWRCSHLLTLREAETRDRIELRATLDEREQRVSMAAGDDYFVSRTRWELVDQGSARELAYAFASWLVGRGVAFKPNALEVCEPVDVVYVVGNDGSVRIARGFVNSGRAPQFADEHGWPPFRRVPVIVTRA